MKEDELFYIQGLMGKVDWEAFAEKNQERLETIKKVDTKVKEVKALDKQKKGKEPALEPTEEPKEVQPIQLDIKEDGDDLVKDLA